MCICEAMSEPRSNETELVKKYVRRKAKSDSSEAANAMTSGGRGEGRWTKGLPYIAIPEQVNVQSLEQAGAWLSETVQTV
ncbi:uncharacterized protein EMH_0067560 [Eimeria mitis]|uniref:Uncharacterized protein n=1 Tax=Eimeria mitis TaxID=44415 RepID=U6K3H4_9EIME|nr:uncharacterized protein EMH_0067560 [Eimeria mitis]CDJ31526.1 hypothetical protein EMH_0067560 [Eimeria mitis]